MKKLLLLFLILTSVFSLSGCMAVIAVVGIATTPTLAKFEDNYIVYNDNKYRYSYDIFGEYFVPAVETFNPKKYEDEKTLLGRSLTDSSIYTAWESDFDDNVLQDISLTNSRGYYFKEGFSLPNYKTLAIDEIFVDDVSSFKPESDSKLYINDIVDFRSIFIVDDSARNLSKLYCTLRDYDSILLGGYNLMLINGNIYIEMPDLVSNTYVIVRDSYQPLFKEIICK